MYEDDFKNGRCQVWDENGVLLADGIYKWDNPVDGTFIIDEIIEPGPKLATFGQYIDAFLNRRRRWWLNSAMANRSVANDCRRGCSPS